MRTHTNDFKNNINLFGKQIKGKIIYYNSYGLISEANDNILTEGNMQIISEQANYNDPIEISGENIFGIDIVKNGNLLQSLMKEVDIEAKSDLNIGSVVNPQLGLLIDKENETYEYLNYGNFIIYSKEFNMDTETWKYVCYDKMLFSMIKYKPLKNVTFPITIKQYINLLCNKIGLEFEDSNFTNYNELMYEDVFANRDMTYRDVFDEISKIVGGNLLIGDNDKLKVGYANSTNDTIDENYLSEVNVTLGKKVGPINSVAILDTEGNFEYVEEDVNLIKQDGLNRITITDNLLAFNGNTDVIAQNILSRLKGLYYYIIDVKTVGVCYYDFLDLFNTQFDSVNYQCLLLNNEINITQGLEEHIYNEELQEIETNSNNYVEPIMTNKQVQFKINQQEGKIESRVEKNGVISAINQSAEEIQINADKISLEGKEINLTSDNIVIDSTNFSVDENGNMSCSNAEITGGNIALYGEAEMPKITITNPTQNDTYVEIGSGYLRGYGSGNLRTAFFYNIGVLTLYSTESRVTYSGSGTYCYDNNDNQNIVINPTNGNITCVSLTQTSKEENKKNFEKIKNAKDILNQVDIYKYNFKDENDDTKKSIGFVIGDGFNYSQEITSENNDGTNIYSMVSVLWQVVKEQQEEINELKEMIKYGKY